ncbi:putative MscS family protein YkuT [compost metagenome]
MGVNLGPLLAGAGVLGLAIGFGAQSLVKDVITGFFIIFEDQFGVGDVIQIDQFKGKVEEIGIRVTRIRSWTGEVHIIPNGSIVKVTNFSTYNSLAVLDISIPYATDVDKAIKLLKDTVVRIFEQNDKIVKEPEVLGVQTLTNTEMKLRIVAECQPNTQSEIERLINSEVKKAMDQLAAESA